MLPAVLAAAAAAAARGGGTAAAAAGGGELLLAVASQRLLHHLAWSGSMAVGGAGQQHLQQHQQHQQPQEYFSRLLTSPQLQQQLRGYTQQAGPRHHHHQQQQQQQAPGPSSPPQSAAAAAIPPPKMTALIMAADSPRDLLQLVVRHHMSLNHIHIIAALNRAAELWKATAAPPAQPAAATPRASHISDAAAAASSSSSSSSEGGGAKLIGRLQLEKLMQQLSGPFQRALPELSAREVASGLWSYAHTGLAPPRELLAACVADLTSWDKLQQAPMQYVLNLTWAAAKLGVADPQLYSAISAAVLSGGQLQQLTPGQLSVLAWSCAKGKYKDARLGAAASERAAQLLQRQLAELAEQQRAGKRGGGGGGKGQRRLAAMWQFNPASLSGLIWGSAAAGWLAGAPQLVAAAARLSVHEPFVFEFTPRAASNLLWGFATSLRGSSATDWEPSSSSSTHEAAPAAAGSSAATAAAAAAAHHPQLQAQQVWRATVAVACGALRRLDEADSASLSRLLWSCATLHSWYLDTLWQQHRQQQQQQEQQLSEDTAGAAAAVAAATAEAAPVFEQLCAALAAQLQRQPDSFVRSVVVTTRALAVALEHRLVTLGDDGGAAAATAAAAGADQPPASSPAALALLQQVADGVQAAAQQRQLPARVVVDLLLAFVQLMRPLQHADQQQQEQQQQEQQQQEQQQGSHLTASLRAAVDALADAGAQLAAQPPGALDVEQAARMLTSFNRLGVQSKDGLFESLLQHWSAGDALLSCSGEALVAALRAAAGVTRSRTELLQAGTDVWQQLLAAAAVRWRQLDDEQQLRAFAPLIQLRASLAGVLPQEQLDAVGSLRCAAAAAAGGVAAELA